MTATSTDTFDQVGIREDLVNMIWNVDPMTTPFVMNAPKNSASNTLHEWQTDTYDAAADNAAIEGADASFAPAAATVRLNNRSQIFQKTAMISGTVESTDRAGRDREMNYQMLKRGVELRRDLERACVGVANATVTGSSTVAREFGSMQLFLAKNVSRGTSGVSGSTTGGFGDGLDTGSVFTDGTQRAFTEALLETVIDSIYNASGEMADMILVGSFNKRAMNAFTGRATTTDHRVTEFSIVSAADVYKSDYGDLKIVPDVFSRARDALIYKKDKWALSELRKLNSKEIAATGDAEKRQMIMELTLEARNEFSSGVVADLTTS